MPRPMSLVRLGIAAVAVGCVATAFITGRANGVLVIAGIAVAAYVATVWSEAGDLPAEPTTPLDVLARCSAPGECECPIDHAEALLDAEPRTI